MSQLCLRCGASSSGGELKHADECPANPTNVIASLREELKTLRKRLEPDEGWPSRSKEWVAGWQTGYRDCENAREPNGD